MTNNTLIKGSTIALAFSAMLACGQSVNTWRGDASGGDWTDPYKWQLNHKPTGDEAAHFRNDDSTISINSTVELNNGMHLYGQELTLRGNGNINMWSQIPHQRTVNIPASATGFANMTLADTLSLNGRIALSAKGFGTSASKGSITLKDRSNVTGALCIGNAGTGTGKVYVKGSSTYRITALELATEAKSGGLAEIHVLGGTVRIETKTNPFETFLADASRRIVIGDAGTVRIEFNMPVSKKKAALKALILQDRLVAAPGCRLTKPIIQNDKLMIGAEDERNDSDVKTQQQLLAAIDAISGSSSAGGTKNNDLVNLLQGVSGTATSSSGSPSKSNIRLPNMDATTSGSSGNQLAGYIVFFGCALLTLRRSAKN